MIDGLFLDSRNLVAVKPVHEQVQCLRLLVMSIFLDTKREWTIIIRRAEMVHKAGNWTDEMLMNNKNDRRVAKICYDF